MNGYNSKLKGWAVDRVIELAKATGGTPTLAEMTEQATELAKYAYVPEEDLKSTAAILFDLVRTAPPNKSLVIDIVNELEKIKQDRLHDNVDDPEPIELNPALEALQ